jgi:hypothetical protein
MRPKPRAIIAGASRDLEDRLPAIGSRGADEDIGRAERLGCARGASLECGAIGEIAGETRGTAACLRDLVANRVEQRGPAGDEHDGGAGARKGERDAAADARARARHQGDAIREIEQVRAGHARGSARVGSG